MTFGELELVLLGNALAIVIAGALGYGIYRITRAWQISAAPLRRYEVPEEMTPVKTSVESLRLALGDDGDAALASEEETRMYDKLRAHE